MVIEQRNAKSFLRWLENYSHYGEYSSLGEAALEWCGSNDGAKKLNYEYPRLLQMLIVILATQKGQLRVGKCIQKNEYTELLLPNTYDGWLPTPDDFKVTVQNAKKKTRSYEREIALRSKAREEQRELLVRELHKKSS